MPVWVIRHAQSQSNAGLPTIGPSDNGLTSLGEQQAERIPTAFGQVPDLIVASPYLRTQLTAKPLIAQFPQVPTDIWPVQEFTYLSLPTNQPTTPLVRRPFVHAYWQRCDPEYIDGEGAESFQQFQRRVSQALERFQQQTGFVVVFSHSEFIKAMLWQLLAQPERIDRQAMERFYGFEKSFVIPNASILALEFPAAGPPQWSSLSVDHLPIELRTPALENKVAIELADQPS